MRVTSPRRQRNPHNGVVTSNRDRWQLICLPREEDLVFRNMPRVTMLAGTIATSLGSLVSSAAGESPSPIDGQFRFEPIQAITYEFGSKLTTGYFVQQGGMCIVTLMITEKGDPENPIGLSPTRVRLALSAGQVAGFDSEEGRSLNLTCEAGAATLLVDVGDRDRLVSLQEAALHANLAQQQ